MVGLSGSVQSTGALSLYSQSFTKRDTAGTSDTGAAQGDSAVFSSGGLGLGDSTNIVLERAYQHLLAVVGDARSELGIPQDAIIDTSPEATGNRIADFALGFFDKFKQNHADLSEDDAKKAFVDLVGGAVQQGIQEARDILTSLSALNGDTNTHIDSIWDIVQQRFDDFLGNNKN